MNDSISRQAAYDTLTEYYHQRTETQHEALREALSRVPTIDTVPVVRCKDCRWYDREREDSPIGYCHACKHAYFSSSWEIGIYRKHKPDFFCADGERSEFPDAESEIDEWWERSETVNAERSEDPSHPFAEDVMMGERSEE